MDFSTDIETYLTAHKRAIDLLDREQIQAFLDLMIDALENEKNIYIFGNGGSAAAASHFAVDINKGASFGAEKRFRVIPLTDNIPTITAYANDISYNDVFVEPLRNLVKVGELVIAISGSGNSENVIRAVTLAKETGAKVVGITGYSGGRLKPLSDVPLHLPMDDMQLAEDMQAVLTHLAMRMLCKYQGIEMC